MIQALKPTVYVGVPDYLKILLDKAKETGKDATSFKKAMVGGGALFPSLRAEYKQRGVATFQTYATADLGIIAYESQALEGMIVDEGVIVEIVRPGTGDPVPAGEVGEVVVTSFNRDYPMIRFATGDLSAVLPGASPCGRTNMRIKGWLGRADQTTKVKGMFVHPEQVAEVAKRHAGVGRVRLVVGRAGEQDTMTLRAEANDDAALKSQAGRDAAGRHQAQGRGGDRARPARCPTTARSSPTSGRILEFHAIPSAQATSASCRRRAFSATGAGSGVSGRSWRRRLLPPLTRVSTGRGRAP